MVVSRGISTHGDGVTRTLFAPVVVIPALAAAAMAAVAGIGSMNNSSRLTVEMFWGFRYSVEPLYPAAIAVILGFSMWWYSGLGLVQTVVATLVMFLLPVAAAYLLAYSIAVYVPFKIRSVDEYVNALLSLRPATEGLCRLIVLAVCTPAFRVLAPAFLILLCWSGATIILLWAYWSDVIAGSYPLLVRATSILGFVFVGLQFQSYPRAR